MAKTKKKAVKKNPFADAIGAITPADVRKADTTPPVPVKKAPLKKPPEPTATTPSVATSPSEPPKQTAVKKPPSMPVTPPAPVIDPMERPNGPRRDFVSDEQMKQVKAGFERLSAETGLSYHFLRAAVDYVHFTHFRGVSVDQLQKAGSRIQTV